MSTIELDAFLADSVASVQGKLYALGAGWSRISVALFPARHDRVGIGLLFRLPAGSANEPAVRAPDARPRGRGARARGGSGGAGEPHRRRVHRRGSEEQIVPIALNLNGLALPGPGDYRVVISMQGQDVKTLGFTVQPLAAQPRQPPSHRRPGRPATSDRSRPGRR